MDKKTLNKCNYHECTRKKCPANYSGVCRQPYYTCDKNTELYFSEIEKYHNTGLTPTEIETLQAENAELKEMVKLAVEDMRHNNDMSLPCNVCLNSVKFTGKPCPHKICEFKWRHSDRLNKILGGENK